MHNTALAPGPAAIAEHDARTLDAARLRHDYFHEGCVIIRNAIDPALLSEMEHRFSGLFRAILAREGHDAAANDDLDALHAKAAAAIGADRAKHFITMGRDFPAFSAIVAAPSLLTLMRAIFATDELQTISDSNVFRIDRPASAATNLEWHQDYPYNMLAMSAATAWMPVRPVVGDMGRLAVRRPLGPLLAIQYDEAAKRQFHNSRYMRIKDLDALTPTFEADAVIAPDMYPGDVLLLHALCLHRSGTNRSERSRWVATARFGPFMDEALYQRTWFTMRAKYPDIFKHHHPDMFETV